MIFEHLSNKSMVFCDVSQFFYTLYSCQKSRYPVTKRKCYLHVFGRLEVVFSIDDFQNNALNGRLDCSRGEWPAIAAVVNRDSVKI